jgi:hypothetical protein
MKNRLFLLLSMICLPALVSAAQDNGVEGSGSPSGSFAARIPGPRLFDYAPPPDGQKPAAIVPATTAQEDKDAPCDQPARLFSPRDYTGPFNRLAAIFSRRPEMTTVPTRRKDGQKICSLDAGQKFRLFFRTTVSPVTFAGAGITAGFSQWQNDDREWGQGAEGYGRRYAAAFGDRATRNFFGKFFYPAIFRQDPRYYRQGEGGAGDRFRHAVAHTLVARDDSGSKAPNFSLWAATVSTVAVENLYHPGLKRGFEPAAKRSGISIGESMGFDVLKEFWPEIVRKLRLPFRERTVVPAPVAAQQ